ncbi:hypothetical protein GCM10009662_68280 [Catellatospora coxensis]|uniref:Polyphosphate kinase-2-related domain-containing protein n=1 Tax=Catellatospora coxensis TaxID=310354 RepID=A0A8J3KT99_9ACTN|nr:hypothetical protein Cco03nite_34100 [Catellatospora coxensis]
MPACREDGAGELGYENRGESEYQRHLDGKFDQCPPHDVECSAPGLGSGVHIGPDPAALRVGNAIWWAWPPAPSDPRRYLPHLPAGGEVVIFDRSWYNRAGVELVTGFCKSQETDQFLDVVPAVEQAIVNSGVILLKYWLEVSREQQTLRLRDRFVDRRKRWKPSQLDVQSCNR